MASKYSFPEDQYLLIGSVVKAHGLRGEISIHSHSGQPDNFQDYRTLILVDENGQLSPELTVDTWRSQGKKVIVRFNQIDTRDLAEKLVGMGVLLPLADLPEPAADEYYWHRLIGLEVMTTEGVTLGRVESLFDNGAQDILVVVGGNNEYLIPVITPTIVRQTDERLVIDPPPGLLAINSDESL